MNRKCRSCGHIQTREVTHCERCGCDLGYSVHFEERISQRQEETSRYLFPLEPEPEPESPLPDTETGKPITPPAETQKKSKPDRTSPNEKRSRTAPSSSPSYNLTLTLAMEAVLIMTWFFALSVSTKMVAPELVIPNWKLGISSLLFWSFGSIMSRLGTGRSVGGHLVSRLIGNQL